MGNIIEVKNLRKYFKTPKGWLHAVEDVSFSIAEKKTLGVVGESGCGKSTLGRSIIRLIEPTDGQILFQGNDITHSSGKELKALRRDLQIIFQDPFSSLDPRMCVRDLIAEPLQLSNYGTAAEIRERVNEMMDTVGLASRFELSYPHELDGGRRQRIGIARALSINPKFIVCDEPVSALDVSIQAQILNLLQDLQDKMGLTYMFITHNLSVVKHISDEIMVMYLGCVVEKCSSKELFLAPRHPYTKGLLDAIPVPTLFRTEKKRIVLKGELTSPINPKPGCRFASRCPFVSEQCLDELPPLNEVSPGHFVACHNLSAVDSEIPWEAERT